MTWDRAREIADRLQRADRARVHIGVMGEYGAAESGNLDDPEATVLDVAYLAEYGRESDPHVPAREPLRVTFERESDKWRRQWAAVHSRYLETGKARRSLIALATQGFQDVRDSYSAGLRPELSEYTLANRQHGGDLPFVDTGQTMRSNIAEITGFDGDLVVVGREGG